MRIPRLELLLVHLLDILDFATYLNILMLYHLLRGEITPQLLIPSWRQMSYPWYYLEVNTLDLAPVVPDCFLGCVLDGELYLLSFVNDAVLKHQLILEVVR